MRRASYPNTRRRDVTGIWWLVAGWNLNGEILLVVVLWWNVSVRQRGRKILLGWRLVSGRVLWRDVVIGESWRQVVL